MRGARAMPQVNLRMPAELKEWLTEKAQQNFRSLTSEIIQRLEVEREREIGANERLST